MKTTRLMMVLMGLHLDRRPCKNLLDEAIYFLHKAFTFNNMKEWHGVICLLAFCLFIQSSRPEQTRFLKDGEVRQIKFIVTLRKKFDCWAFDWFLPLCNEKARHREDVSKKRLPPPRPHNNHNHLVHTNKDNTNDYAPQDTALIDCAHSLVLVFWA